MECTPVANARDSQPLPQEERSPTVVDLIQELLVDPHTDNRELESRLAQLAKEFNARSAGLAGFWGNSPIVQHWIFADGTQVPSSRWPWEEWPELLAGVRRTPLALPAQSADGKSCLLTSCNQHPGATWLLWLEDEGRREWSTKEQGTLTLAVLALARGANQPAAHPWSRWLERSRRQQRLEEAAIVVGRLVHDFNNVLTGILGFTELTLSQLAPNSASYDYINGAFQAAQQGTQLITQLSLFSKRSKARSQPADLAPVVAEEEKRVRKAWGDAIVFEVRLPEALPALAMDPDSIQQVLGRLLDNAREAIAAKGTVTLSAREARLNHWDCLELFGNASPGPFVEITVSDTGAGFSEEARQRIFAQPFFSTKPRHRGLGLASVYGILHAHRGGIRLEHSSGPGTVAHVYVPPVNAEAATPVARHSTQGVTRGEKVLVVDDDPLTVQLISTTLERAGYRAQAATTGTEALAAVSQGTEPFRLVLVDVVMPGMTGFDLAERLLDRDPRLKVLFMSGCIPASFVPGNFRGWDFELLAKPFRPEVLLQTVRSVLERNGPREVAANGNGSVALV